MKHLQIIIVPMCLHNRTGGCATEGSTAKRGGLGGANPPLYFWRAAWCLNKFFCECVKLWHIGQKAFIKIIYWSTLQHLRIIKNNSLDVLQGAANKNGLAFSGIVHGCKMHATFWDIFLTNNFTVQRTVASMGTKTDHQELTTLR